MRKLLSVVVALFCVVLLSSCALWPFGLSADNQKMEDRMAQIAAAVDSHDAAALKSLFSPRALERATDIDAGIDYFLSFFPNGGLTWEREPGSSEGHNNGFRKTELLNSYFKVSADGVDYSLFFADFTVNEVEDTDNVGLYGLGVTAWTDHRGAGASEPFFYWAGSFRVDTSDPDGYPGVFVGYDNTQLSLHKMGQIVEELNTQDHAGLREDTFSVYAQAEDAAEIDGQIDELYALFPEGEVVWEDQEAVPVVRESADNGGKTTLLISTYRVSLGAVDYRLSFAYFTEYTLDPSNVGLYAIGVAPWTEAGDSAAEQALFAWADSFDVDASIPPGIFIPQ